MPLPFLLPLLSLLSLPVFCVDPSPFVPFTTGIGHHSLAHLSFLSASPAIPSEQQVNSAISLFRAEALTIHAAPGKDGPPSLLIGGQKDDGVVMECGSDASFVHASTSGEEGSLRGRWRRGRGVGGDEKEEGMKWEKGFAVDFLESLAQIVLEGRMREYDFEIWESDETKVGRCELRLKEIGVAMLMFGGGAAVAR